MNDLESFVALYKQFGIEVKLVKVESGTEITLGESGCYTDGATISDKFEGYTGFFSTLNFDENGKFIKQGFWE